MIKRLHIKNVALITEADVNFTDGLNVLTGETGSGKSVVIECINFVLGAKADKTMIKGGATECLVEVEFEVDSSMLLDVYSKYGFEVEDTLIISRKLNVDGRGSIRLNGNSVTIQMLKDFTSRLVDVHGQSEHFYLLDESNQLDLIDGYGKAEIAEIKAVVLEKYLEYKTIENKLNELGGSKDERIIKIDVLKFQIDEIEKASIQENEEEDLKIAREKLLNKEKIEGALIEAKNSLDKEQGAIDQVDESLHAISTISKLSNEFLDIENKLVDLLEELKDVKSEICSLEDTDDDCPYTIDEVEERLALIKKIKRKYGNSYEEINEFYTNAVNELKVLENFDEENEKLIIEKEKVRKELFDSYCKLHDKRIKYADIFSKSIVKELVELNMKNARFMVKIDGATSIDDMKLSPNGFDTLQFMFSANLGEELKPLSKVISGGEISRLMLGIKAQTAKYGVVSTFIFDEIDSGIGGKTAKTIAEKFVKIAKSKQIIAITHLAQIAVYADCFNLISKTERDDRTHTEITSLDEKGILTEIARLVSGDSESKNALSLASDMLNEARINKRQIS